MILHLDTYDAIQILEQLGCGQDPAWAKREDGQWYELKNGLIEFEDGAGSYGTYLREMDSEAGHCETCTCRAVIEVPQLAYEMELQYYSSDEAAQPVTGTLLSMVLDRMGVDLIE